MANQRGCGGLMLVNAASRGDSQRGVGPAHLTRTPPSKVAGQARAPGSHSPGEHGAAPPAAAADGLLSAQVRLWTGRCACIAPHRLPRGTPARQPNLSAGCPRAWGRAPAGAACPPCVSRLSMRSAPMARPWGRPAASCRRRCRPVCRLVRVRQFSGPRAGPSFWQNLAGPDQGQNGRKCEIWVV